MKRTIDTAKIALKKQIPRKVTSKKYVDYERLYQKNFLIGECSSCKWTVLHYENYCCNCGQRLDWK